jgi:hypothetical protein
MDVKFSLSKEGKKLGSIRQHSGEENVRKQGREINRRIERITSWEI